jgi:hypothetical protein
VFAMGHQGYGSAIVHREGMFCHGHRPSIRRGPCIEESGRKRAALGRLVTVRSRGEPMVWEQELNERCGARNPENVSVRSEDAPLRDMSPSAIVDRCDDDRQ